VDEFLLLVTESPVIALNDEDTSFAVWMFERPHNAFHGKLSGISSYRDGGSQMMPALIAEVLKQLINEMPLILAYPDV
jgi:hypothetical protein